jgi:hypothetical protein
MDMVTVMVVQCRTWWRRSRRRGVRQTVQLAGAAEAGRAMANSSLLIRPTMSVVRIEPSSDAPAAAARPYR